MDVPVTKQPQHPIVQFGGIVDRSPSDLTPWPNNPRIHPEKQLAAIKAAMLQFGVTAPILVDENGQILSGHGRVQAALALGLASVPTRVISGLSEAQKRAYVLADNKIAELSKWDQGLLKSELEILIAEDFAIETTGFSTAEIDVMFDDGAAAAATDPDDLQPSDIPTDIVSQVGDLWQLGNHYLLCGNALDAECYQTVMRGELAELTISDAPYNLEADSIGGSGKIHHQSFAMASGEMTPSKFTAFLNRAFSHTHAFSQDGSIHYYFMDWRHMREIQDAAVPLFGPLRQLCVWAKHAGGMGSFYRNQHELVFVFKKGNAPHINNFELGQHGRYRTNVWNYSGIASVTEKNHVLLGLHPTIKPVGLIADAIRDCSHRKGIILDPFAGSGTLLIAAERTGRHARVIEIDPQYVDVGVQRWQRVTGKQAVLVATGQTWDQVRAERLTTALGDDHDL